MIQRGKIVEFQLKNKLTLGICLQEGPKQIRLLTDAGREINFKAQKILHVLDTGTAQSLSRTEQLDALKTWQSRFDNSSIEVDLKTLWEVLLEEKEPMDIVTLAEMNFGDVTDEAVGVLLRRVLEDGLYFEQKGDLGFLPRSEDTVAQIQAQRQKEEERLRERQDTQHWIQQCLKHNKAEPPPERAQKTLNMLQDVAVKQDKSNHYGTVQRMLQDAGLKGKPEDLCLELMIKSGIWDKDINLHLIEYDVPRHFSQELLAHVDSLELALDLEKRQDLRHAFSITIDDEATTDIDDAVSWERLDNGHTRIQVHIADPAEYVIPDSLLDTEAAKRFTSIYLCEGKIEMLPARLSQELCSLVQGQPRQALTLTVEVTPAGEVLNPELTESVIEVKQRLSYSEVDAYMEKSEALSEGLPEPLKELPALLELTEALKAKRLERGAVEFFRPELRIQVTEGQLTEGENEKEITLKVVERDSPAQKLVSELMILANNQVAEIMRAAQIPLIYKVQQAPTEERPDGTPLLKRAEMSTRADEHYGLGLTSYTQFTSPIRRYNDLVLHRQLKHWLHTGEAFYNEEQIQHMIALSDQALFSANYIQRENFKYWLYTYFSRLKKPRHVKGVLKNVKDDRAWVHLPEYCNDVPMAASEVAGHMPDDEFVVLLDQIQPRKGRLLARKAKL